jgi:arsenate reductase (thioredoxin)
VTINARHAFSGRAQLLISAFLQRIRVPLLLQLLTSGLALLTAACASSPQAAAPPSTQILIVCEHGNVKSLMATNYFNELAQARNLPFRAISRGTAPDSTTVPPAIVEGLRADGFEVANFRPTAVTASDVESSRHIVVINTKLPAGVLDTSTQIEEWGDVPPASVDYGDARDVLKTHVSALFDQLSRQSEPQ